MIHKIFTVKIQLFHLGFIAEIIIDPTRQSNRFQKLLKSFRFKVQKWTVNQNCTVLKLNGLESNRRISDRPILICWAVYFDFRPMDFESFLTRSRSRFLDRPYSEFNNLKSLSNFGFAFLSDQFADQSEPDLSFSAKRTENGSTSDSRIFSKIRSLGSKDSRLSQSESSSSSAKRELGRDVPRRSQRLRSSVSENDRQIFERSRFDIGIDLTVTIFIKSIVVQNDISDR